MTVEVPTIKAHQSSVVWNSGALFLAGLFCAWKIGKTMVIKAPFGALGLEDFLMAGNSLQQVGSGGFILWKRIFRPLNRPIVAGPALKLVERATGTTTIPKTDGSAEWRILLVSAIVSIILTVAAIAMGV